MTPANIVAFMVQATCIIVLAGAVMAVPRIATANVRYAVWRGALLLCLALPFVQTPQTAHVTVSISDAARVAGADAPAVARVAPQTDWAGVVLWLLAAGAAVRGTWVALGLLRLRTLRRLGEPVPAHEHAGLQRRLGTYAHVKYADTARQPVTFGVFSPVVLLPSSLRSASESTREAVLTHELLHVRRRDWCWVLVEEAVRAVVWFHPAVWWLITRIQLAREEVVDAGAVAVTGRRADYVNALLICCDEVPLSPAPAFARRRHLFRRIVLLSTEEPMSTRRLAASMVAVAVVLAGGSYAAISAFPYQASSGVLQAHPGPVEQSATPVSADNPLPQLLAAAAADFPSGATTDKLAASVTLRTVVDQGGTVAEVRLAGLSLHTGSVNLSMGGRTTPTFEEFVQQASLKGPGGEVISATSLRPLLEAFIDAAATAVLQSQFSPPRQGPVFFNTTVHFLTGRPATMRTAPAGGQPLTDGALRVGRTISPPKKIKHVPPTYPPDAKAAGVQGVVIADVRVEADGRIRSAHVLRSVPLLDDAALDAIRQWEFQPTLMNGEPIPIVMTVTVQFTLQ